LALYFILFEIISSSMNSKRLNNILRAHQPNIQGFLK